MVLVVWGETEGGAVGAGPVFATERDEGRPSMRGAFFRVCGQCCGFLLPLPPPPFPAPASNRGSRPQVIFGGLRAGRGGTGRAGRDETGQVNGQERDRASCSPPPPSHQWISPLNTLLPGVLRPKTGSPPPVALCSLHSLVFPLSMSGCQSPCVSKRGAVTPMRNRMRFMRSHPPSSLP